MQSMLGRYTGTERVPLARVQYCGKNTVGFFESGSACLADLPGARSLQGVS